MEISAEHFASVKELALIQEQIAKGRAELKILQENQEEYVEEREKIAVERVEKALETSKSALSEAEKNRDALAHFLSSARELVKSIKELGQATKEGANLFEVSLRDIYTLVDEKSDTIQRDTEALRIQRHQIESERGGLEAEKRVFEEEKRKILDLSQLTNKKIEALRAKKI